MKICILGRSLVLTVLIASLPAAASAQTLSKTCLSTEEAEGLVTYALPTAVRAISKHCAKTLPATAALVQSGVVTAARYQVDADKAWPVASAAFDKVSGLPVAKLMGEKALKPLIEETISTGITQNLQAKDCGSADRLINILQPLPTRNMAMLVSMLLETGNTTTRARLPISICPAPAVVAEAARK
jgi:hypothetical protein